MGGKQFYSRPPLGLTPMFRTIAALVLGICAISNASCSTLHVSPDGNDSHSGTAKSPLLTISRASNLAAPGDTVVVHEGVYRERVAPPRGGEPGKPISYIAAPGERVIIKGSEIWQPEWQAESPGLYSATPDSALFDDLREEYVDSHNPLEVELASTPWEREGRREKERGYGGDDSIVFTCGQVFVNGERYREVPLKDELHEGHWFYESSTKKVYVHFGELAPADQFVELTTRRRIFAPAKRGLGYITVQGFVMEHCGNQYPTNFWETNANAQKGALGTEAGHHWIIRRNLIRHAKTFAIDAGYVDKRSRRIVPEGNLIEENYIVDNGSAGILSNASRNMTIRGNVILRNNLLRFFERKRWEQAGIKCHNFKDGLIEGNYVAENILTYGIWLDNQFPDSRVTRNVLVNNERAGLFLEMSDYGFDRLLVDNNVIVGNRENPVYIHDASGATFVHNLLADTKPSEEYGQAVFIRQVSPRTKTYHHSFYNNLMLSNDVAIEANYPSHRSGPQRSDYNVYNASPGEAVFRINPASEKPSPWDPQEFLELMQRDLGEDNSVTQGRRGLVNLTLEQWCNFWRTHNLDNDRHSSLTEGRFEKFDSVKQTITLSMPEDPASYATRAIPDVTRDFFDVSIPADGSAKPGPFQGLGAGTSSLRVWSGLPLLTQFELPPTDWNRIKTSTVAATDKIAHEITSPDGEIKLGFSVSDTGDAKAAPAYKVWYEGQPIVSKSLLGFELGNNNSLKGDFEIASTKVSDHDVTWRPVCGERNVVRDHYRQLTVNLRQTSGDKHQLTLDFRCYDEGVAFRYRITGESDGSLQISKELTQFSFLGDHTTWATTNAQGKHEPTSLSALPPVVERPLVMRTVDGPYVAVAEAAMHHYASMMLSPAKDQPHTVTSKLLSPVVSELPLQTPWRVIMIADSPGELLENNDIIRNLNEKCVLSDTSWIKPGKVLREITLTTAGGMASVDFAVKHNFQFIEFDAGWYGHEYHDSSDATTISVDPKRSPGPLDLHKVIRYAEDHGIGVILYVNRRALERQLDKLLPLYKSWGIKGVKYGFVRNGDQEWNNWLHEAILKAAKYELMVDVHDGYRSTGYQRTLPNLMTIEGIGGDETGPTNELALMNLFTRMLSGRADHTFCYFDDRVGELQTHACQLGKPICFFSPWQFLFWYDSPLASYADNHDDKCIIETPELEFWDHMPTVWDDTRVLHASIGEFAMVARRSGEQWFVGSINNQDARVLETPLTFLDSEREFVAHRYYDDPTLDTHTKVGIERIPVTKDTILRSRLRSNGGEAIRIVPAKTPSTAH